MAVIRLHDEFAVDSLVVALHGDAALAGDVELEDLGDVDLVTCEADGDVLLHLPVFQVDGVVRRAPVLVLDEGAGLDVRDGEAVAAVVPGDLFLEDVLPVKGCLDDLPVDEVVCRRADGGYLFLGGAHAFAAVVEYVYVGILGSFGAQYLKAELELGLHTDSSVVFLTIVGVPLLVQEYGVGGAVRRMIEGELLLAHLPVLHLLVLCKEASSAEEEEEACQYADSWCFHDFLSGLGFRTVSC